MLTYYDSHANKSRSASTLEGEPLGVRSRPSPRVGEGPGGLGDGLALAIIPSASLPGMDEPSRCGARA